MIAFKKVVKVMEEAGAEIPHPGKTIVIQLPE